eukprot:3382164-Pyramimonas_sp.AAC.1
MSIRAVMCAFPPPKWAYPRQEQRKACCDLLSTGERALCEASHTPDTAMAKEQSGENPLEV